MAISVGSVAVDVVPDTKTFATDLKAKLKDVRVSVDVTADTTAARAQIDEVAQNRRATIEVNADTASAEAQIDAAARDRRTNVGISGIGTAISGVSALGLAIATLGPALIPITAAVAGLGAALVAPLAFAGGGLTIGALIAGKAIADTKKQQKTISDLAKKVAAAKLAVEQASTPAGKKSAMLREAEATKAYQTALDQLTPSQKKFIDSQDRLKASFAKLTAVAGPAVFGPVIKGMDLLASVLPKLKPLLTGVASGVDTLLTDLGKAASGPGFKAFVKSFGTQARDAIVSFGRIFGNVMVGLTGFFRAFAPLSKSFVGGLGGVAGAFAKWGTSIGSSKTFQSFLAYVKDVGPKVAAALGHVFQALGEIAVVIAPMGGLVLGLVDGLSKMVTAATPAQLAAVATGIGAIGVAVLFATGGLSGLVPAIAGLGVGLAFAYSHSTRFRTVINDIARVFTDHLFPALRDAWKTVLPGLMKGFDNVKDSVHKNQGLFRLLGDVFKGIGVVLVKVVIPAVASFYRVYLPILGKAIGVAITVVRLLADGWLLMAEAGLRAFKLLADGAFLTFGQIVDAAAIGLGWLPGIGPKVKKAQTAFHEFADGTTKALDKSISAVQALRKELDTIKPKTVKVHFQVDKPPALMVAGFPVFKQPEGAGARGAIINRPTVALIGESGPERLTPLDQTPGNEPLPPGRAATGGPLVHVDTLVAHDYADFMRQSQERLRMSSSDGVRRVGVNR